MTCRSECRDGKGHSMQNELRGEQRYSAKDGAIAAFFPATEGHSFLLGQILDISTGGLALRYFAKEHDSNLPCHLEIFGSDRPPIYIENVPAKVVYDFHVENIPGSPFGVRRCGVQFGELSERHVSQLKYFIRNYTANDA